MPDCSHWDLIEHPKTIEFVLQIINGFPDCQRVSCQSAPPTTQPPSTTRPAVGEPQQVATAFVEAWNTDNRDAAEALFVGSYEGTDAITFDGLWPSNAPTGGFGPMPDYPLATAGFQCREDRDRAIPFYYVEPVRTCQFEWNWAEMGVAYMDVELVQLDDGRWHVWHFAIGGGD